MSEILLIVGTENDTFNRGIRLTTCYNKLREALPITFSHVIIPCKF